MAKSDQQIIESYGNITQQISYDNDGRFIDYYIGGSLMAVTTQSSTHIIDLLYSELRQDMREAVERVEGV